MHVFHVCGGRRSDGDEDGSLDLEGEDNPAFDYPEEEDSEDSNGEGAERARRRGWDEEDEEDEDAAAAEEKGEDTE